MDKCIRTKIWIQNKCMIWADKGNTHSYVSVDDNTLRGCYFVCDIERKLTQIKTKI